MTRCDRDGCPGSIDEHTGFCDTCYRQRLEPARSEPVSSGSSLQSASVGSVQTTRSTGRDGILALPVFEFPAPSSRILGRPEISPRARKCTECGGPVGQSYAGQAAINEGYCQQCGQAYSFLPNLSEGDLVAGQYEVVGYFARGGLGWVYLARDTHLDGNLVVLKGLIDASDAALAKAERDTLIRMDHPNIVRIFNFVEHPDLRTGQPREYIVMEYVDGLVLNEVQKRAKAGLEPLGEPLRAEHVIACGLRVLAALDYLHGRGLLYCDMKPENVILRPGTRGERAESRIKIIDLGAVRRIGDRTSTIIGTKTYQVSSEEITEYGLTTQSDIHTVGRTLTELYRATVDWSDQTGAAAGPSPVKIGLRSFERLRARAVHRNPHRRFTSAAEMADQLMGVQREISALRERSERPAPSTMFVSTPVLLDAGLGVVPPLDRWTNGDATTGTGAPMPDGKPEPAAVATGLPTPVVDPGDPAAGELETTTALDPRRLLDKLATSTHDTPELHFARCRAYLELGDLDNAREWLRRAESAKPPHDWRVVWHEALFALARGDVPAAEKAFDTVYSTLPGELAPKLALGYCAEQPDRLGEAERLYEAVWRRDHAQGSAAFGLARIRLAHGDRAGAVAILDEVPKVSRHYDSAAVAAVLVLSGQLRSGAPTIADLTSAIQRLPNLFLDGGDERGPARDRVITIIREAAFVLTETAAEPGLNGLSDGPVLGDSPDRRGLRVLLEQSYRGLAQQARNHEEHNVLIDLKNRVRPWTWH